MGGLCDFSVSPSPFGLDFGTLDFGTSDLGLTISDLVSTPNILRDTFKCFLVMLWKYGGFYLDLDYVVFNDLRQFENIIVGNGE